MTKEQKGLRIPIELIKKIEKHQEKYYLPTFTAAVIDILRRFFEEV